MTLYTMAAVAVHHHHQLGFKPPAHGNRRCKLQSFAHLDYYAACTAPINRSFSTPCLSSLTDLDQGRVELIACHSHARIRALVAEAAISLASGLDPRPVAGGLGGAYVLFNRAGERIAVVKPVDEEPLAVNNPKGFAGMMLGQPGLKRSVKVGETAIRELAAYLLDHGGFAGVPPTALTRISHPSFHISPHKIASIQRYIKHSSDAADLGPSCFSISSVHRIGILDIRILNLDRHSGNLLVKKRDCGNLYGVGSADLVPIDHGLCLPEWLDDPYFEWLHWPQASVPFSDCELDYISNLDPLKDSEDLRSVLPSLPESSIRVFIVCSVFLKRAALAGLCLSHIGEMITRDNGELSVLEKICLRARNALPRSEEIFHISVSGFLNGGDMGRSKAGLGRSVSFSTGNSGRCEGGGTRFGEMSSREFDCFLGLFEEILPQVFQGGINVWTTQRLGSSCRF